MPSRSAHLRPLSLTLVIAAMALLPSMATIGMFMDGTIYASISRNLAEGIGTYWRPHFSEGLFPVFHEHPPLMFWLQSLFFRALGDSYLTERIYDLCIVLATATLIVRLWRGVCSAIGRRNLSAYVWLPLLLWVAVPKWAWTYRNNMLENTLTMLCLAASLLILYAMTSANRRRQIGLAALASIVLLLSFLTKGLLSLFVLAVPILIGVFISRSSTRDITLVTAVLSAGLLIGLLLLALEPDARNLLQAYFDRQLVYRMELSSTGLGLLIELVKKLAAMLGILLLVRIWLAQPIRLKSILVGKPVVGMGLIGCSSSLPLLLAEFDSAHYLIPSMPFFAIAFGLIGASMLEHASQSKVKQLTNKPDALFITMAFLALTLILAYSSSRIGDVRKNESHHTFLAQVSRHTGPSITINIDDELYQDWYLHAIAMRHHRIHLSVDAQQSQWLIRKQYMPPPQGYRKTLVENSTWQLLERTLEQQ